MKSKQLAIMVALAALLGGAAFFLNKKDDTTTTGGGGVGAKVIELPVNDVAAILIQSASGKLGLAKKDDVWTVEERAGYPANFERVHGLLMKLWELKTVQEVKVGASQFARLELAEPLAGTAVKIDFKDKDGKSLGALLLGKKHMKSSDGGGFGGPGEFPAGRYVMQPGGSRVSLVSETLDEIEAKPESWLARDFFKIDSVSAITLAGTTDAQKWKVTRENTTAEWKLDGAKPEEKADAAKVSTAATAFQNPTFTDVLAPDAKPEAHGLDKPAVVTIETFDGFTYVLKIGKLENGNAPVMVEVSGKFATERTPGKDEKEEDKKRLDEEFKTKIKGFEEKLAAEKKFEGRAFLVAQFTIEQIVRDRSALLAEKKPETPATGTQPGAAVSPNPGAPKPATTPPLSAPAPPKQEPVEAVTPPVSIPPTPKPAPAAPAKPTVPAKPEAPPVPENKSEPAPKPAEPKAQ